MNVKEYLRDSPNDYIVMTRQQVRDFDAWAINELGVPGVVLMENAGRGCAEILLQYLSDRQGGGVCIFCGAGNNGGDGYVIARHLANHGVEVKTVICADPNKIKGDALINLEIIRKMNLPVHHLDVKADCAYKRVGEFTEECDLIVDAIFGTGLTGELRSEYVQLITCINAAEPPVIAVDIPSGLDCDTGLPLPVCIEADATVTFGALKKGFADCPESAAATGKIYIASIGVEPKPPGHD